MRTHAGSHPPWDVGEWYCSPSVDSASASLPGCCSSNSDAVARSTHTLHRCQTWAGGEEGRKHIHTHACTPRTQKHTHTHTRTQTHTHRHTHRSDLSLVFWCTVFKFNVVDDVPDMNYILKRHYGNSQRDKLNTREIQNIILYRDWERQLHMADQKCTTKEGCEIWGATQGETEVEHTSAMCPRLRESRTWTQQVWVNYIGERRWEALTFQSRLGEGLWGTK